MVLAKTYKQIENRISKKEAEVEKLNKKFESNPKEVSNKIYLLYDELESLQKELVLLEPKDSHKPKKKHVVFERKKKSSTKLKWTLKTLIEEAKKHKSLSDWNRYSYSSYSNAKKMGVFEKIKKEVFSVNQNK